MLDQFTRLIICLQDAACEDVDEDDNEKSDDNTEEEEEEEDLEATLEAEEQRKLQQAEFEKDKVSMW